MVRDICEKAETSSPLLDMLRLLFFANDDGVARHRPATRPYPGPYSLAVRTGPPERHRFERELLSGNLRGVLLGNLDPDGITGGDAASMGGAHILNLLDVCRGGFRCVLYCAADNGSDR